MTPTAEKFLIALVVILVIVVIALAIAISREEASKKSEARAASEAMMSGGAADDASCAASSSATVGGQLAPAPNLAQAQQEAWYQATASGENLGFDPSAPTSGAALEGYHTPSPAIDYQEALVDYVADDRMRAQHSNWHSEVAPKSQTAMTVDNADEAAALSNYNGHGLYAFRGVAPAQNNPLFVTDQDGSSYKDNVATQFRFGG